MGYPTNLRYTKDHEWVSLDGKIATVGITDFAQRELGDIVFVEMPEKGRSVRAGDTLGTIESVKAVSEIYSAVTGKIVDGNAALKDAPETVNRDPHGAGWLAKIELADPAEVDALMDAAAYEKAIGA